MTFNNVTVREIAKGRSQWLELSTSREALQVRVTDTGLLRPSAVTRANHAPNDSGEALRALRTRHGLSLRKVAAQIGWSCAYLSDLETGKRLFTAEKAKRFREAVQALRSP